MANYRLYCLGRPILEIDGKPVKLEMRKSLALLVYLGITDHDYTREFISTLFWSEYDQQHAQANLRRVLSSLNKSLQGDLLGADRENICLKDRSKVWLDVAYFQKLLSTTKNHSHANEEFCPDCMEALKRAIGLYRGDFLEGFNLGDCPDFDEWQFLQRESLRQEFARALQRAAEWCEAHSDWEQAIAYSRRWVALDQLHEPAQRFLINLYSQAGQRSAGMKQYSELVRLLQDELGQEPEPETTSLYHKIRDWTINPTYTRVTETAQKSAPPPITEPLLKSKLYIPSSRVQNVKRQHILHELNQIGQYSIAVLSAPAGFGKTTTLVDWISQSSLPVGWYSLDSGDNDVVRFLSYFIAALESIQSEIGIGTQSLLQAPQAAPVQLVLTHLLHNLESLKIPAVLVLDDYQFITNQAIHDAVSFFLDHLPTNLHLIFATRADPPLGLTRWRLQGRVLEIRVKDLRFTPEETFEFLTQAMGLPLTMEDVILLDKRIEGWAVGYQMVSLAIKSRLSLTDRAGITQFIQTFSGSYRYILDYLTEEVLSSQPKIIHEFLLKTSILERLSSPVCDAVLGKWDENTELQFPFSASSEASSAQFQFNSHQQILEYLERSNLFITALDDERNWYSYHHLFADLLRARLNQLFPGLAPQLHARAAKWYEENGLTLDAIHHASLASDFEWIERIIEQNYIEMMNRGEMSSVRYWTGKLSKEVVTRRPWLCLYEALNLSWFGQLDEANFYLNEAEKRIQLEGSTPDKQTMLGYHNYVKSRVTAMQGDTRRAIELCQQAREAIPDSNLGLQIDFSITHGYEYFLYGDFANADKILQEMIRSGINAEAVNNPVAGYAVLARSKAYQGRLHEAYDLLQKAALLIQRAEGQYLGVTGLVEVGVAALLCEWNDLQAALVHIKQGLDYLPLWGKADDLCLAYTTLARIQLALGNRAEAVEAIEKALQLIQTSGVFSEARSAVEAAQVKLWLVQRDWLAVDHWASTFNKRFVSPDLFRYEDEWTHITQARVFIAQSKPDEAIRLLSSLEESARSAGRNGRLIEILVLEAIAQKAVDDGRNARLALEQALSLGETEDYRRIFLDEGEPMTFLLKDFQTQLRNRKNLRKQDTQLFEYVQRLLTALDGSANP